MKRRLKSIERTRAKRGVLIEKRGRTRAKRGALIVKRDRTRAYRGAPEALIVKRDRTRAPRGPNKNTRSDKGKPREKRSSHLLRL